MSQVSNLLKDLRASASKDYALVSMRFFKTGQGEYGEGDVFIGVRMPVIRGLAKNYAKHFFIDEVTSILASEIHEERMLALAILTLQFKNGTPEQKREIYQAYLEHIDSINNWDLVDTSAPHIVGEFLLNRSRSKLYSLVKSKSLWRRRIAIVSTFTFIRHGEFEDCLALSKVLLGDKEDLMHKATGWMLREVGKKSRDVLDQFLAEHAPEMPRTMLRYAIEKHSAEQRAEYLGKK